MHCLLLYSALFFRVCTFLITWQFIAPPNFKLQPPLDTFITHQRSLSILVLTHACSLSLLFLFPCSLSHSLSWSDFHLHLSKGGAWLCFILKALRSSVSFLYWLLFYYPQMAGLSHGSSRRPGSPWRPVIGPIFGTKGF